MRAQAITADIMRQGVQGIMSPATTKTDAAGPIQPAHAWVRMTAVLSLGALVLALYWPTVLALGTLWADTYRTTYTHGFLIAALCLWLLIRRRSELARAPMQPSSIGPAAVLAASLLWLLAWQAHFQLAHEMLLPLLLWTSVFALFGWPVARLAAVPCAFLLFAMPCWEAINWPLQRLTIAAVGRMLLWVGVPVHIAGDFVQLPVGSFEIAGGCSGLHFVLVALAIGTLYGELHAGGARVRLMVAGLALALSILANWIRVFTIVLAGDLSNMQHYLVRVDHYRFGWLVFAVTMLVFFLLAPRLPAQDREAVAAPAGGQPEDQGRGRTRLILLVTLLSLSLGPVWAAVAERRIVSPVDPVLLRTSKGDWSGPLPLTSGWRPTFASPDAQQLGRYRKSGLEVEVYRVAYAKQRQNQKLLGYGNSIFGPDDTQQILSESRASVAGRDMRELELRDESGGHWLLWQTYQVGHRVWRSPIEAQLWYGMISLFTSQPVRMLAVRARCAADCAGARAGIGNFIDENMWVFAQ